MYDQSSLNSETNNCTVCHTPISLIPGICHQEGIAFDENKVKYLKEWPAPCLVKLQGFIGFANFYRRFIRNFSSITAPLTALLKGTSKKLTWSPAIDAVFNCLKNAFTIAPIHKHLDPDETELGTILFQCFREKPNLHPVTFFPYKLSPVEHNYYLGNPIMPLKRRNGVTSFYCFSIPQESWILVHSQETEFLTALTKGSTRFTPHHWGIAVQPRSSTVIQGHQWTLGLLKVACALCWL